MRWPDAVSEAVSGVTFVLPPGGTHGARRPVRLPARAPSSPRSCAPCPPPAVPSRSTGTTPRRWPRRGRPRPHSAGAAPPRTCSTAPCARTCAWPARARPTTSWSSRCARRASAPWLASLPDGLDTALGDHGGAVSGGERQRLAVARVAARRPPDPRPRRAHRPPRRPHRRRARRRDQRAQPRSDRHRRVPPPGGVPGSPGGHGRLRRRAGRARPAAGDHGATVTRRA